jgi:hypothetical protein
MFYMSGIAAVLTLSSLRILFTWSEGWFRVVHVILFALVVVAMTQRLWLQWKVQHRAPSTEDPPSTPPTGTPLVDSNQR